MFQVVEDWSGDVQKAFCRFIETSYYPFRWPNNNSRVHIQGPHSLNHAQNTRSRQAEEVVFHVRVCKLFMLCGVRDSPNTAYTLYKKALENTVDGSTGFMDIVDFVFDGAWTASNSLEKALLQRIQAQPQISQYPNYSTLIQAMESKDDFLTGLIRYVLKVEDVQDIVDHWITLTALLGRNCRRNDKKMKQGLPPLSSSLSQHHDTKQEQVTPMGDVNKALAIVTTGGANNLVKDIAVQPEVQHPICLQRLLFSVS